MEEKRFYWLKLKRDFFKRHDIRIIEEMPNGKEYVLFYLKLLVESIDHDGALRFSDTIPYSEQMLSVITNTNIDIVRSALKIFGQLNLIEIMADDTLFMNEVEKLIGSETQWAEKKRLYREKGQCPTNVLSMSDKSKSIEKEKDKELDKKESKEKKVPPTLEEVKEYAKTRNRQDLAQKFFDYYNETGWKDSKGQKVLNWKAKFITWENKNEIKQESKPRVSDNSTLPDLNDLDYLASLTRKGRY